jgi:Ribosomal protein L7/L12 C-terminal domain
MDHGPRLMEAKDLIEGALKNVKEGVGRNEVEKIKVTLNHGRACVSLERTKFLLIWMSDDPLLSGR